MDAEPSLPGVDGGVEEGGGGAGALLSCVEGLGKEGGGGEGAGQAAQRQEEVEELDDPVSQANAGFEMGENEGQASILSPPVGVEVAQPASLKEAHGSTYNRQFDQSQRAKGCLDLGGWRGA